MNAILPAPSLVRVRALYEGLQHDIAFPASAPPGDPALSAEAAVFVAHEARLLDGRAFASWLELWDEDGLFYVPLDAASDPANDQALFLDDHRRIKERIWRMSDASAWALQPAATTVRLVGSVEAWPAETADEVIVVSAMLLQHTRLQTQFSTAGRQIHRIRRGTDGWRLYRKILILPQQAAGTPHLGWLL